MEEVLARAVSGFAIEGDPVAAEPWGSGHIHESFRATIHGPGGESRILLQRMNLEVFPDPDAVARNIRRVTDHLRAKLGDPSAHARRVLRPVRARSGGDLVRDAVGGCWRAFEFVPGTRTADSVDSPATAHEAARAFGGFLRDLADLPAPRLEETIPAFHDSPARLAALEATLAADPAERAAGAGPEIEFALSRATLAPVLLDAARAGRIPERATHNDTKVNNLLLDERTGEAVCVIDLDTVMPGLSLYDFGDLVRTSVCAAAEDERDLSRVAARPDLYRALVEGWLEPLGPLLTAAERDLLLLSARLLTWETGVRFLADHLAGDRYFRIHRPGHNLDRARVQFALLRSLEAQEAELAGIGREA